MDNNQYENQLSGLDPLAWLSGQPWGNPSPLSGASDSSLSGGAGAQSGFLPGMQGGLGLDALTELLQQQRGGGEGVGVGQAGDLLAAISGNIGQGTLAQGGQGYAIAGQTTPQSAQPNTGYQIAGQTGGTTADPTALLMKLAGQLRPSAGTGPGAPSAAFQTQREGERADFTGGAPPTGGPTDAALGELGMNTSEIGGGSVSSMLDNALRSAGVIDANAVGGGSVSSMLENALRGTGGGPSGGYSTPGAPNQPVPMTLSNVYSPSGQTSEQQFIGSMLEQGWTADQLQQLFGGAEQALTGGALPDLRTPGAFEQQGITPQGTDQQIQQLTQGYQSLPTNWGGVLTGGLGGATGLINAIRASQAGNIPGGIGGGLQSIAGLSSLLRSSPQLAQSLGLTPDMLNTLGATTGGLGGLLGLYGGIQGLQRGDELGGALGLAGGALSGYGALQSLSKIYPGAFGGTALPQLGDAALNAIGNFAPETAAALKEGLAATASGSGVAGLSGVDYANLLGLALAAASPFIKKDPDNAALMKGASTALTAASAILSQTGYGAALAAAMNSAMAIYGGIQAKQTPEQITANAIYQGTPIAMLDLGGGLSEGIVEALAPTSQSWRAFGGNLAGTLEGSGLGLGTFANALPYVESQAGLADLIGAYERQMQNRGIGGYGEGNDPFNIANVPGAGGSAHEWGQTADFGPQVNLLQQAVTGLRGALPETGGSDPMALWNQMLARDQAKFYTSSAKYPSGVQQEVAPEQMLARMPDGSFRTVTLGEHAAYQAQQAAAVDAATRSGDWSAVGPDWAVAENVLYGDPRYNYAAQGIPAPNWTPGPMSSAWQQLMAGGRPQAQQQITPEQLQALLGQMPSQSAQGSTGLMGLMQSMQPQAAPPAVPGARVLDEDLNRNMFQQYLG